MSEAVVTAKLVPVQEYEEAETTIRILGQALEERLDEVSRLHAQLRAERDTVEQLRAEVSRLSDALTGART